MADELIYVSLIVPIYNQEKNLPIFLKKIIKQKGDFLWEIILIDDGSTDASLQICKDFCEKHTYASVYSQSNKGVSAARNMGIKKARGKYLFFIDSDDDLTDRAVTKICNYFDSVYDQTDLVTYPIKTIYNGNVLAPHFRYNYLKHTGLYDLRNNPYIGQTTMNIVVKNYFADNVLFNIYQTFSEDQRYCCDILSKKLIMGYYDGAEYIYNRSDESSSGRMLGACFIFEQCTSFFEELFSKYEDIPLAYQGLFVNDFYWKMCSNALFPYHYSKEEFDFSINRLRLLIRRCDPRIILNHPTFDYFEKFYLLKFYNKKLFNTAITEYGYSLFYVNDDKCVSCEKSIEFVVTRFQIIKDRIKIKGFLKTVFFLFYDKSPELFAVINNGEKKERLNLKMSAHNYYLSHEQTQMFYSAIYEVELDKLSNLSFLFRLGNVKYPVHFYFMPLAPFSHLSKKWIYKTWRWRVIVRNNCEFRVATTHKQKSLRIWLYYDNAGMAFDNGLLQYMHDYNIDDGIVRYYVLTDKRQLKQLPLDASVVHFGDHRHKKLLFQAEKVITAYIEDNNIIPYPIRQYEMISDRLKFETIYLQHGVLHIEMPWKYNPEKILADKIVVSSDVDYELFKKNGYKDEDLWKVGMPRFDVKKTNSQKQKKILFAPSWRNYLVTNKVDNGWEILEKKLLSSKYFKGIKEFLDSQELKRLLKDSGYEMDVKFHPIFSSININLEISGDRISIIDRVENESVYSLFITDFSSYMFDFLFRDIPVLSYIPDYDEFTCGMNGYRRVDFMNKVEEDAISKEPWQILNAIRNFMETGKGMEYRPWFYVSPNGSMNEIYQRIISS